MVRFGHENEEGIKLGLHVRDGPESVRQPYDHASSVIDWCVIQ